MRALTCLTALLLAPAAFATTGGPDSYGYTFIDSDEPGGPAYTWTDISGTGLLLALSDDSHIGYTLTTFSFPFYGGAYTDLAIGSNGVVYFDPTSYLGLGNTCPMPGTVSYTPQALIAAYWDDLNPTAGGAIYVQELANPTRLVVQWQDVPTFSTNLPQTFQAVLFPDGAIHLAFENLGEAGDAASFGIQNDAATGLQYSTCNTAGSVHNGLLVRFDANSPCAGIGDADLDGVCDDVDFVLASTAPIPGQPMTMTAAHAPANALVYFLVSSRRDATNPLCHPTYTATCTDLQRPRVVGTARANASGTAMLTVTAPGRLPPSVFVQAFYGTGGVADVSNVVGFSVP